MKYHEYLPQVGDGDGVVDVDIENANKANISVISKMNLAARKETPVPKVPTKSNQSEELEIL